MSEGPIPAGHQIASLRKGQATCECGVVVKGQRPLTLARRLTQHWDGVDMANLIERNG